MDDRVDKLTDILTDGFKKAGPLKAVRSGKMVAWWTSELNYLRRESHILLNLTRNHNYSSETWSEYTAARRAYDKAVRYGKRGAWKDFTNGIKDLPQASKVHRMLVGDNFVSLGQIKKSDGRYTSDVSESLEYLLKIHFPNNPSARADIYEHRSWLEEVETIVSAHNVIKAMRSFGAYKSAGPDVIFPDKLIVVLYDLMLHLVNILKASLKYGYVPNMLRTMKIVFIPKPCKDSYQKVTC
jgi:hypothetical protein